MRGCKTALFFLFLGLGIGNLTAQSATAVLTGTVLDQHRAVVAGVPISLHNTETGLRWNSISDSTGNFRFAGIPAGIYELRVQRTGFATYVGTGIPLTTGQEAQVIVTLSPAPVVSEVTVQADVLRIDPSKTTLSLTFTAAQIQVLPLAGRDFALLGLLVPGILRNHTQASGTAGSPLAAAAQHGRNNTFLLDGLALDDTTGPTVRGTIPLDAIQEITIASGGFGAEYGQASGAVVNVVTKSGTNHYSGLASYYHRDDAWDATPGEARLVAPPLEKSKLRQTTVGGVFGAPILRNRAFFFGAGDHTARDSEFVVTSPALAALRPGTPASVPQPFRGSQALVRVDVAPGGSYGLTARYRIDFNQLARTEALGAPERGIDDVEHAQDAALMHTARIGSAGLNEFRLQNARWRLSLEPYCAACPAEIRSSIVLGKSPNFPQRRLQRRAQVANTYTHVTPDTFGDHTIKSGFDVSVVRTDFDLLVNRDGTFRFPNDAPFDATNPETYPTQYTRSIGDPLVRIDQELYSVFVQDQWRARSNLTLNIGVRWDYDSAAGVSKDVDNLAPRIGLAFDPWKNGRSSLRGSYGIYYDQLFLNIARQAEEAKNSVQVLIRNPGYPDPFGPNPLRTGGPVTPLTNTIRLAENMRTPYTQQFSVGGQHSWSGPVALELDFVWARGRSQFRTRDSNYPDLSSGGSIRPNPNHLRIELIETLAQSWYKALQLAIQKRHSNGYSFTVAYTLSSSEREAEDWNAVPQDHRDLAVERGPGVNDARHQLSASGSVELPYGLRFSAVLGARSSLPYNITTGFDDNRDTYFTDRPARTGRNSARGAPFCQADVRLAKEFRLGTRRVEVLAEAFNVANTRNWSDFDGQKNSSTFTRPRAAGIAREVQLGVKFAF